MIDKLASFIDEIVEQTMKNGGSASKPSRLEFLPARDLWCFPKYPARTVIHPRTIDLATELKEFIAKNESYLNEEDCWLGTWINLLSGEYYLDVATGIHDLEEARQMAFEAGCREQRSIVALFNPKKNQTIYLPD